MELFATSLKKTPFTETCLGKIWFHVWQQYHIGQENGQQFAEDSGVLFFQEHRGDRGDTQVSGKCTFGYLKLRARHFVEVNYLHQWEDGSYMSALGGAVSLYLGISLAMMFEVLELIVDVVVNFFATKFGNKSK